jgi:1-phosphofructokinase family hexose kinase
MFLCISANPAIDKRLRVGQLRNGEVNRAREAVSEPGGKAAHVAMALAALRAEPTWIGFSGGPTGEALVAGLQKLGIRTRAVPAAQPTRVNLAIAEDRGAVTEILEPGGRPSSKEVALFREACRREFARGKDDATVILSGSLPPGAPADLYAELIRTARKHGCRVLLDSSGEALRRGLEERPDLVKPNREEAEWLTGVKVQDLGSAREALLKILAGGAPSAALSLGKDGLLWCRAGGERVLRAHPPSVDGRSAVGSGDAAMAGFALALAGGKKEREVLLRAAACGTANVLANSPGRIRLADVRRIEKATRVEILAAGTAGPDLRGEER